MGKKAGDKIDLDFWRLLLRLLHYPLKPREIKYLLWRFYNRMNCKQIAQLDGRKISAQGINRIFEEAYKKIKVYFGKP